MCCFGSLLIVVHYPTMVYNPYLYCAAHVYCASVEGAMRVKLSLVLFLHVMLLQCHQIVMDGKAHCRAFSFVFCSVYCMKIYRCRCVNSRRGSDSNRWHHH